MRSTKFDHPLTAHNAPPEHKNTPHLLFHELANQLAQKAQHFLAPYCGMSFLAISALFLLCIHFGKSLWFTWIPCNEASACRVSIIKQTNKQTNIAGVFCRCPQRSMYSYPANLGMSKTRPLVAVKPRRPPLTDVGTETAFRLDQRKHFRKSKLIICHMSVTMALTNQIDR